MEVNQHKPERAGYYWVLPVNHDEFCKPHIVRVYQLADWRNGIPPGTWMVSRGFRYSGPLDSYWHQYHWAGPLQPPKFMQ